MFGNIFIIAALAAAVYSSVKYYQAFKGNKKALTKARYGFHIMSALVICTSLFFLFIILSHQYQYKYVFEYSSAQLSTGLLMSSFYAGQEGSFMLWLLLAVIIGIILQSYSARHDDLEPAFMAVYTLILVFLILMVTPFFKSPFELIWSQINYIDLRYINQNLIKLPVLQSFVVSDPSSGQTFLKAGPDLLSALQANGIHAADLIVKGKGLNPLLQNFWMEVHPPILFAGYALSAVPFTFAMSALMKNKYDSWIKLAIPWTITATAVLGLGLMIGGYWAYGVLGWGGFWGWDPVENASLIPWLAGAALIHTLLLQRHTQSPSQSGRYAKTNLVLAVLMFILVLYSTFLTRSGILSKASVHYFENPGAAVYIFLVLFICTFSIAGFGGIFFRRRTLSEGNGVKENFLSRETGLLYGSLILIASAVVVFAGTSAPILGESVEVSFYNKMNLPLALIMCLLIGLSLFLKRRTTAAADFVKSSLPSLAVSIFIAAAASIFLSLKNFEYILFLFSIIFTVVVNVEMLIKVFKNGFYFWGGHLAHIGLALFLFGVLASAALTKSRQVDLPLGVKTKVLNADLDFTSITPIDNGTKYAFNISVDRDNKYYTASPVMFFSDYNNSLMREPYILEGLTGDLYFSPISYTNGEENKTDAARSSLKNDGGNVQQHSKILTVEVSTKPFIFFVWFGIFIMSIGFLIAVLRRNKMNKIELRNQ